MCTFHRELKQYYEYERQAPHRGLAPLVLIFQTSPSCNIFTKILELINYNFGQKPTRSRPLEFVFISQISIGHIWGIFLTYFRHIMGITQRFKCLFTNNKISFNSYSSFSSYAGSCSLTTVNHFEPLFSRIRNHSESFKSFVTI